jgi:DNA-binding NarL/FixJ family response regulator
MRRCLICDDHALMREALAGAVLGGWPDAAIEEAADFRAAWAAAASEPDLIVSDLAMPGAEPLDGIRQFRAVAPSSPVLVITGSEDDALLLALFDLGIAGFVPKSSRTPIITAAIQLVLSGGTYLPPAVLDLVGTRSAAPVTAHARARLTPRQADVLRLIAAGRSNKEIARDIDLSPATVKAHAAAAIAALGAANRTEAVVMARAAALI